MTCLRRAAASSSKILVASLDRNGRVVKIIGEFRVTTRKRTRTAAHSPDQLDVVANLILPFCPADIDLAPFHRGY
jgi:hypothetical protein